MKLKLDPKLVQSLMYDLRREDLRGLSIEEGLIVAETRALAQAAKTQSEYIRKGEPESPDVHREHIEYWQKKAKTARKLREALNEST